MLLIKLTGSSENLTQFQSHDWNQMNPYQSYLVDDVTIWQVSQYWGPWDTPLLRIRIHKRTVGSKTRHTVLLSDNWRYRTWPVGFSHLGSKQYALTVVLLRLSLVYLNQQSIDLIRICIDIPLQITGTQIRSSRPRYSVLTVTLLCTMIVLNVGNFKFHQPT